MPNYYKSVHLSSVWVFIARYILKKYSSLETLQAKPFDVLEPLLGSCPILRAHLTDNTQKGSSLTDTSGLVPLRHVTSGNNGNPGVGVLGTICWVAEN